VYLSFVQTDYFISLQCGTFDIETMQDTHQHTLNYPTTRVFTRNMTQLPLSFLQTDYFISLQCGTKTAKTHTPAYTGTS